MLLFGGESGASFNAVAEVAEELKVPYVAPATIYGVATMKYNICLLYLRSLDRRDSQLLIEYVKPKTVACLAYDDEAARINLMA